MGVDLSHQSLSWRLGTGNVHSALKDVTPEKCANPTTPEEQEYNNAIANLKKIVAEKAPMAEHQVILYSQYGKGITIVTDEILSSKDLPRDTSGRLVIPGDGLFTTKKNVLLLNKSGDAHSIILESPLAVGVVVGSWRCIEKGILPHMLEHFLKLGTDPKDINIYIGPGLGKDSYDLPEDIYQKICKENPSFSQAFTPKLVKEKTVGESKQPDTKEETAAATVAPVTPPKPKKYILDFIKLIQLSVQELQIKVIDKESVTTFDRAQWNKAKQEAKERKDPLFLIKYYQSQLFFSARLYTHVDKNIRKIVQQNKYEMPQGLEQPKSSYDGTGRCVNGIIRV